MEFQKENHLSREYANMYNNLTQNYTGLLNNYLELVAQYESEKQNLTELVEEYQSCIMHVNICIDYRDGTKWYGITYNRTPWMQSVTSNKTVAEVIPLIGHLTKPLL